MNDMNLVQDDLYKEYEKSIMKLIYTGNLISIKLSKILKKHKISLIQYNILKILEKDKKGLTSLKSLQEQLLNPISNCSRNIDALFEMGYVSKKNSQKDKRLLNLYILKKGQNLLDKIDAVVKEQNATVLNLSKEELTLLNDLLGKIKK